MPTGAGKIPSFMDSERMKTPKTDCLLRFMKGEKLDSRLVDLENKGFPASLAEQSVFILSSIPKYIRMYCRRGLHPSVSAQLHIPSSHCMRLGDGVSSVIQHLLWHFLSSQLVA